MQECTHVLLSAVCRPAALTRPGSLLERQTEQDCLSGPLNLTKLETGFFLTVGY